MYVVDSRQILASYLDSHDEIMISKLNDIARSIEKSLTDVCVDVSHYSIDAAIEDFSQMFIWKNDITICKPDDASQSTYLFDAGMPSEVKQFFEELAII